MKAIIVDHFGGPENLQPGEYPTPSPSSNEVLIKVEATALNRADILQREGKYPPPKGESPILGLELAGIVVGLGEKVTDWKKGDRLCGLLGGGGYAEYAVIHEKMALPLHEGMSFEEAAAIPEVFLTAFQALKWLAGLKQGELILVHAGASGVGTAAIQLAKVIGAQCMVTASPSKHDLCLELGASHAIDYKAKNYQEKILELTNGKGVDVVLDFIGAPYFQNNLNVLKTDGRMVMLAFLGGVKLNELDLRAFLAKRLHVMGSTLRIRPLDYKIALIKDFKDFAWPLFKTGRLQAVIDTVFNWTEVAEAHLYMEANRNKGKIVLKMDT